ncbi:trehalose utilization protein ThuA [Natronolimnobius sp. AArcel1]|uniref:ThuA domain-containing protein n=1 Tax=Natronolimnobius sp. AArcel1 TaxID=1679093 RepID=UPI0013EBFFAB|nr:ThuA domain-containing protein [Natronolimnobius sp. AArcel1]NGM67730.1 trehalose utilization protein ThuA [Natronolimnobius sp. AArcel1]
MATRVTVWNENVHEQESDDVAERYPDGIHGAIAAFLEEAGFETQTATLQEPDHGLTEDVLAETDVLVWWSHCANHELSDEVATRVVDRVHNGMGFVPLHSAKNSKPFKRLLGTTCNIKYRHGGETERLWAVDFGHPIVDGLPESFEIPETEMYGEPYDVPEPDRTVFISWFEGGEVFRSGLCYRRGRGRIFAFRPGHEEYPIYYQVEVQRVIENAVHWAAPNEGAADPDWGQHDPIESLE